MRVPAPILMALTLGAWACDVPVSSETPPCESDEACGAGEECDQGVCVPETVYSESGGASSSLGSAVSMPEPGSSSGPAASVFTGSSTDGPSSDLRAGASSLGPAPQTSSSAAAVVSSSRPVPTRSTLGVVVRTGTASGSDTDDPVRFCLNAHCFPLNLDGVDDRQRRETDTYVREIPYLAREDARKVVLETPTGGDAWRPVCLQVVLDGEPLYCKRLNNVVVGNAAGETRRWEDHDLSADCSSCLYGAMVGATTRTTAKLWTRAPGLDDVQVEYALDDAFTQGVQRTAPVAVTAAEDHTAHVNLTGLSADTTYFYRVMFNGVPFQFSPHPKFTTAPQDGTQFTVAFGSCADDNKEDTDFGAWPVFNQIATHHPDIMLMLGDNHYANPNKNPDRTRWLGILRSHYRKTRTYPSFMSLLGNTPTYGIWDDHDFLGNDTRGASYPNERVKALQAFKEFWANPGAGTAAAPGAWYRFSWGKVDFFMLDARYHREGPGGTMLGSAQLAWLKNQLSASTAAFKIVASGSVWHSSTTDPDGWGEHHAERDEIIRYVFNHDIRGVLFMAGDIHRSGDYRVPTTVNGGYPLYEFVSSGLAQGPHGCGPGGPNRIACVANGVTYGLLKFNTGIANPSVTFEIRRGNGTLGHSRTIRASALVP